MKWRELSDRHVSYPYRIYRSVLGHDAWIYSKHGAACLGKGIATIDKAKAICEAHSKRPKEPA